MLRKIWIEVRSSLWFVPSLLVILAIGLASGLVELDVVFADVIGTKRWQPLLNAGAEGARGMLTAIAGSMITVAGVAFSITIVTLSLASTQYTPRILRNFMRDRANQFVLGFFVAIFTYCLIVLRTIRGGAEKDGGGFVPLLAVAFGLGLALLSIVCLIFFIHHVAASIQASGILQSITQETLGTVDRLFPEEIGEDEEEVEVASTLRGAEWHPIAAGSNGYVQQVDPDALINIAKELELVARIECRPGDFAVKGAPLLSVNRAPTDEMAASLRSRFSVGDFRTVDQDASFGIRQIVDIALKALSPGVNDTTTAVTCLDYLSAILCRLTRQRLASPFRGDEGELHIIALAPSFRDYVAECFDEIRLCAASNVTILLHLLHAIERVAHATESKARREALGFHARLVRDLADRAVISGYDRQRINLRIASLRAPLQSAADAVPDLPITPG